MYILLNAIVYIVGGALILAFLAPGMFQALADSGQISTNTPPRAGFYVVLFLLIVFALASLVPTVAVQVRRFHDQDKSGWLWLLHFVPYVGGIVVFVFMCLEGTEGPNRFGPDPKGEVGDVFE